MPDISTRINALIAYLFLGPIMLLAREGTPLADTFVREHAKKSSIIIVISILVYALYHSIHSYFSFGIFGISFDTIVVSSIVSITLLILIVGAYRAFRGVPASTLSWRGTFNMIENTTTVGRYTEEDGIHIIASFIPFIGIVMAHQYQKPEILIGRKVGNLFTLCILMSSGITTITLIITLIYIGLIVATAVQLFGFSRFLELGFYRYIPTYIELDAHIKASIVSVYQFGKIVFGGHSDIDYRTRYTYFLSRNQYSQAPTISYFVPTWCIALPIINLITLPSLGQSRVHEYIPLILQGFMLTLCMTLIILIFGTNSQVGLYLLFPIITIMVEGRSNILTRAPFTSIAVDLYSLFILGRAKVTEIKKNGEEKVQFTYNEEVKNQNMETTQLPHTLAIDDEKHIV